MTQQVTGNVQLEDRGLVSAMVVALDRLEPAECESEVHRILAGASREQRAVLAADENCPVAVMSHLINDRPEVQDALAANPVFTRQVLVRIVMAKPWRFGRDERGWTSTVGFQEHPCCPDDDPVLHAEPLCWFNIRRWLLHPELPFADFRREVVGRESRLAASLIGAPSVREEHLILIAEEMDSRSQQTEPNNPPGVESGETAEWGPTQNGHRQREALAVLAKTVEHPRYPDRLLRERSRDPRWEVRSAVAGNPRVSIRLSRHLISSDGWNALVRILSNTGVESAHLDAAVSELIGMNHTGTSPSAAEDRSGPGLIWTGKAVERALVSVVTDLRCEVATLRKVVDHPSRIVRETAQLRDPATTTAELKLICVAATEEVAEQVAAHPSATPELMIPLSHLPGIGQWLVKNPQTSSAILTLLLDNSAVDARQIVAHRNMTERILLEILNSPTLHSLRDASPGLIMDIVGCHVVTDEILLRLLERSGGLVQEHAVTAVADQSWQKYRSLVPKVRSDVREKILTEAGDAQYHWAVAHENPKVRYTAAKLGRDVDSLLTLSQDPDGNVRRAASQALLGLL